MWKLLKLFEAVIPATAKQSGISTSNAYIAFSKGGERSEGAEGDLERGTAYTINSSLPPMPLP
jgi:hypothetical protein